VHFFDLAIAAKGPSGLFKLPASTGYHGMNAMPLSVQNLSTSSCLRSLRLYLFWTDAIGVALRLLYLFDVYLG